MAGWMKTPLGTEVDLGLGHIVLDGVPAPAKGTQQPPSFRPMSIVATVAHLSHCWALVAQLTILPIQRFEVAHPIFHDVENTVAGAYEHLVPDDNFRCENAFEKARFDFFDSQ